MTFVDLLSKYLHIMEFRFEAMLYSNLGKENSDAGHIKCSRRPHLARGPQVPHPWLTRTRRTKRSLFRIKREALVDKTVRKTFADNKSPLFKELSEDTADVDEKSQLLKAAVISPIVRTQGRKRLAVKAYGTNVTR